MNNFFKKYKLDQNRGSRAEKRQENINFKLQILRYLNSKKLYINDFYITFQILYIFIDFLLQLNIYIPILYFL
jgi:hypothetical protein